MRTKLIIMSSIVLLAGCSILPQQLTREEVSTRVETDISKLDHGQELIDRPISLEEAVARTLKYNLDYRLKKMESALALGLADYSQADLWPKLLTSAGYNTRDNDSGGTSVGIEDRVESLRPSTSVERRYGQLDAELSWNILDFGVSYYRAKQKGNEFLAAEERRRKLVQNMIQDVRSSYWRALGAQRLEDKATDILKRANKAIERSREAESQKIISPSVALNYQRALLDATLLLNQRRQNLVFAKRELAALMNVTSGVEFTLADATEAPLVAVPSNVSALEEMALLQRPELREEDYKKRITADETRKQMLGFLPNLSVKGSFNSSSNDYLFNEHWKQASVNVTWNLLKIFSLPAAMKAQEQQVKVDQTRSLSLSMAILTQLHISVERYRLAVQNYNLSDTAANVDKRLAAYTKASVNAKLATELEAIRTEIRAVLGDYQRTDAYANAQIAFGRLYNSLGFDPLEDDYEKSSIAELSQRIKKHFLETEHQSSLKMTSNLFGNRAAVSLIVTGVNDVSLADRMVDELEAFFARNKISTHDPRGFPLIFNLVKANELEIDETSWNIHLEDKENAEINSTYYTTKIPENSRDSVLVSTLVAAATSELDTIKGWLADADLDR